MKSATFVLALVAVCASGNVIVTKPGQTKTLECGISDGSSILKWMKGSELLYSVNPKTGMASRGKGELVRSQRSRIRHERDLEISTIKVQDAGEFTCLVKSQQQRYWLVVASVSVTPTGPLEEGSAAVLQCDATGPTPSTAVQWVRPGEQSGHTSPLHINAVTKAHAGLWECVFSADGQTMKETVTLEVIEPRPKTTSTTTTTTLAATKTTAAILAPCPDNEVCPTAGPPPGLSWWVWAAVGGGALVLLLWVLILLMFHRMRRRKIRFMKMRGAAELRRRQYCQCPGGPTAVAGHGRTKPSAPPCPALVLSVV